MIILRYFRFICVSGVVVSAISFVLGTVAIATGSWLLSQGEPTQFQPPGSPQDPGGTTPPGNLSDLGWNRTDNVTVATTTATVTELTVTTDPTSAVIETQSTEVAVQADDSSSNGTKLMILASSGLWHICQAEIRDGEIVTDWVCWNIIQNLASMQNTKQLTIVAGRTENRLPFTVPSPTDISLTVYIETSGVYFQSLLAFELISVAATLAGCCIATVAMYKQQPLAVLVAAFTMFFAGMFMLVGHLMMLSIHKADNDEGSGTTTNRWYYGWSFILAWLSFSMCLVSGIINCIVYRNFRKMSEELTGTPSRVKYANRPPPISLGSGI